MASILEIIQFPEYIFNLSSHAWIQSGKKSKKKNDKHNQPKALTAHTVINLKTIKSKRTPRMKQKVNFEFAFTFERFADFE